MHFQSPYHHSLIHVLSLLAARHSFSFTAPLVRGKRNPITDSLSHFQFQNFRRLAPYADSIPTQILQQLFSDLDLCSQINATSTWLSCRASNVTKAQISVSASPSQSNWCTLFLWLQQYNALGCLLYPIFWIFMRRWVHCQLPLQFWHPPSCQQCPSRFPNQSRQLQEPH